MGALCDAFFSVGGDDLRDLGRQLAARGGVYGWLLAAMAGFLEPVLGVCLSHAFVGVAAGAAQGLRLYAANSRGPKTRAGEGKEAPQSHGDLSGDAGYRKSFNGKAGWLCEPAR